MRDYSFGNFISALRERRGLSQYQLGALVGVSDKAAYGHFPRPSGPRSPTRQGHIKRPVLRLAEPSFLRPANQCC